MFKKIVVAFLACALVWVSVGCAEKPVDPAPPIESPTETPPSPTPTPSITPDTPVVESPKPSADEALYEPPANQLFGITSTELIDFLSGVAELGGFTKTSDLAITDSRAEIPESGFYNMKTIVLGSGVYMYLSETIDSEMVFLISGFGMLSQATDESLDILRFYIEEIVAMVDYDNMESTLKSLNIDSTEDTYKTAKGRYADLTFFIAGDVLSFSATPSF